MVSLMRVLTTDFKVWRRTILRNMREEESSGIWTKVWKHVGHIMGNPESGTRQKPGKIYWWKRNNKKSIMLLSRFRVSWTKNTKQWKLTILNWTKRQLNKNHLNKKSSPQMTNWAKSAEQIINWTEVRFSNCQLNIEQKSVEQFNIYLVYVKGLSLLLQPGPSLSGWVRAKSGERRHLTESWDFSSREV